MKMSLNARRQAGFSIVEVMVAFVILSVGMLGIASLYVTTLRSSGSAISRMQAVNLASDMADRIRSNRFARVAYEGVGAEKDCMGIDKNCSQEDMAANDVFLWQQQIDLLLPGNPQGTVDYAVPTAADAPDNYTITVSWKEAGADTEADDEDADGRLSYTLTMQVEP
jgi:type IV pilus assembly protein PilV